MSEPEKAAEHKEGAAAPKKKKPMLLILAGGLMLGGAGLGGYLFLGHKTAAADDSHATAGEEKHESEKKVAADKKAKTQIVTLKPIVVNLRNSKGTRFLKVTIGMETTSEAVASELQKLSPQLSDFLIDKFCNVEITDVDNSVGRNKLKREILAGTNELLENGYVSTVYFTEFVIQ